MKTSWFGKVVVVTAVLGMLAACGTPSTPTAAPPEAPATAAPEEPPATGQALPGPLHILNWQGYGSDEPWALQAFEERYGVEIVHDYYNSNEELLTKLRTSPGVYDAVLIGNTWGWQAIEEGLLQPVDTTRLTNFADLSSQLVGLPEMRRGDTLYGIPWDWGATGIAYNPEVITEEVDSWEIMWDPRYAGRIAWQDYYLDNVMFAAIALGQDPNHPSDLDAIRDKLMALMPQLRTFWASEDEFNKLFSPGEIVLGTYWSGSSARAAKMGLPIRFVVPREGAIGWVDSWAIPAGAPHYETALAWIDYMVSPEFYLEWDARVGAPVPSNEVTVAGLPEDSLNKSYLSQSEVVSRLFFYAPLSEEVKRVWVELWEEVKALQ